MTEQRRRGPEPPRTPQGAHPRRTRARRPGLHRRRAEPNVPILEITQAADVGMGSFYNHFDSKEQLFDAAVEDALDAHGAAPRPAHRRHRRPRRGVRAAASGSPGGCTAAARSQQGPAAQRPRAHRIGEGTGPPCPPRHRGRRPRRPVHRPRPRSGVDHRRRGRAVPRASCCTTTRSATTPSPPTRSPRTCCACSASPPTRPTTSAGARCPTPTRYRKATRPRRAVQPIIGRRPAIMAPCFLRGRRLTEGPTSDCSPGQVDLRGDTLGTHQDRNSPS